jgi:dTDP-glucose pyrophosphorylase
MTIAQGSYENKSNHNDIMMNNIETHIIHSTASVRTALIMLDRLAADAILFVADEDHKLIGSLTDGDLRRGFIKGLGIDDSILKFIQKNPAFIKEKESSFEILKIYKDKNLKIIPILNDDGIIVDVFNFRTQRTIIPINAVLMAGGEGKRLRPHTEKIPKPLLEVGGKPIIEYNIDRLISVGVKRITLSINYLGEQLTAYFLDGAAKGIHIDYIKEDKPMGTLGSISMIDHFDHDDVIVMNSDLLTNIDFADFYKVYKESGSDMAVAATSFHVDVPYAVLKTGKRNEIKSLTEKPRYTYYSNAGIYLVNKKLFKMIPKNCYCDVTDFIEKVIEMNYQIITYPITGYWLDIGKPEDYQKAQEDIKYIKW